MMRYITRDTDKVFLRCGACKKVYGYPRQAFEESRPEKCAGCDAGFRRIWFYPMDLKKLRWLIPCLVMTGLTALVVLVMRWPYLQKMYYFNNLVTALSPQIMAILIPVVCSVITLLSDRLSALGEDPTSGGDRSKAVKRLWVIAVAFIEIAFLIFYISVTLETQYSVLQIPDPDTGAAWQYYGSTVGEVASGEGRLFDSQGNLIYWGGFKDNLYEGYGEKRELVMAVQNPDLENTYQVIYRGCFSAGVPDGHGSEFRYDASYDFGKNPSDGLSPYLVYEGEFVDGKYCGYGTKYSLSRKYQGTFFEGNYHGYGTALFIDSSNNNVYKLEGSYSSGTLNGTGRKYYSTGNLLFEGTYQNGSATKGILYFKSGAIQYNGDWDGDEYNGTGTLYWENGQIRYIGGWYNDRYSGQGTYYREDGIMQYEGNWSNGTYNGYGSYYREDGTILYTGQWRDSDYSGYGTMYWGSGKIRYQGDWLNDTYNGPGKLYYEDGETCRLDGYFVDGQLEGYGIQYHSNGIKAYEGEWQNGVFSGHGKEYGRDGEVLREGYYIAGEYVSDTQNPEEETADS